MKKISDILPKVIFDQSAETLKEIAESTGLAYKQLATLRDKEVLAGNWVEVWKRDRIGRRVRAYKSKR